MTEIEPIDLTTEDHLPEPELEAATPVTHTEQYVGIVTSKKISLGFDKLCAYCRYFQEIVDR